MPPSRNRRPGSGAAQPRQRGSADAPRRRGASGAPGRKARAPRPIPEILQASAHDAATGAYFGLTPAESGYHSSRVVILPVPYGGTVTYGGGTEKGPEAIRIASQQVELFDEETRREPYRAGIHSAPAVLFRGKD